MAENTEQLVLSLVREVLGPPKSDRSQSKTWWDFNCPAPACGHDYNKYNFAYNTQSTYFHCWKCHYNGYVFDLVTEYGTPEALSRLKIVLPKNKTPLFKPEKKDINYEFITCNLPKEYLLLSVERKTSLYRLALNYVINTRKITPAQIDKYRIGYTEHGDYKFRIILPSLNTHKKINYFEARSYLKNSKQNYKKPPSKEVGSSQIIYNEYFINWDLPVYLVEGVFDALRLPNAIPLLGKTPAHLIINKLLKHRCKVVVCLDADAIKEGMEIYKRLSSLGLDVFFLDLTGYKDVSMIYEKYGQSKLVEVMKGIKKIDKTFELTKLLNE